MHICLFDIDGTLLNTGGAGGAAMLAAMEEVFGVNRPIEGIPMAGRTDRAITHDLFRYFEIEHRPDIWTKFVGTYLRLLPTYLGEKAGEILPGIGDLIAALGERDDVALGLLTGNFREGARLKLSHFDLYKYFKFGGYGDEHHDRDDVAREVFAAVQKLYDSVNLEKVWVIGDTPADVKCGRAIGAQVIAVATGHYTTEELATHNPHHCFADFSKPNVMLELLV